MGGYVTAQRYKCSVCSEWIEREQEIAQTRQLPYVSWVRTWVHPRCVKSDEGEAACVLA